MPMSVSGFSWIQEVFYLFDPHADPSQGFEINGQRKKPIDSNHNGVLDPEEWQDFLQSNLSELSNRFRFFRFFKEAKLDPNNLLNDRLAMEAKRAPAKAIQVSYAKVGAILARVRAQDLAMQDQDQNKYWRPIHKLRAIRRAIEEEGIRFQEQQDPLLATNLQRLVLDCDTLSEVIAAVGYEMHWPIFLVFFRDHVIARWDDGITRVNLDNESSYPDETYREESSVAPSSEREGVYMANMNRQERDAFYADNCGIAEGMRGDYLHAIEYFTQAIELNSKFAVAFYNRGLARARLLDYTGAIEDFTVAVHWDPNFAAAFYRRGIAKLKLLDPFYRLEIANLKPRDSKNLTDVEDDLKKAALDPKFKPRAQEVKEVEEILKRIKRQNQSQARDVASTFDSFGERTLQQN